MNLRPDGVFKPRIAPESTSCEILAPVSGGSHDRPNSVGVKWISACVSSMGASFRLPQCQIGHRIVACDNRKPHIKGHVHDDLLTNRKPQKKRCQALQRIRLRPRMDKLSVTGRRVKRLVPRNGWLSVPSLWRLWRGPMRRLPTLSTTRTAGWASWSTSTCRSTGPGPPSNDSAAGPSFNALEAVKLAWAERERLTLRRILDTIIGSTPGSSVPTVGHARLAISLECNREGQVIFRRTPEGPVALFTTTLQGLDARRFGRCQVCARYFYAPRLLPDGTPPAACPPPARCARILRTRRHRAKQADYELARKLKT